MEVFIESGLVFRFASGLWAVRKYDEHEYYLALSGAGLKGMDILGIWKGRQLVLVEVKNYRNNPVADGTAQLPPPEVLLDEMARKVEDTFTGLSAIRQMLERKGLYRAVRPLIDRFPLYDYDWPFWTRAGRLAELIDQTKVLLVLEGYPEALRRALRRELTRRLAETSGTVEIIGAGEAMPEGLVVQAARIEN